MTTGDLFGARPAQGGAVFSPCGLYRYELRRTLSVPRGHPRPKAGSKIAFLMLNPSTADALTNDATVAVVSGFASRAELFEELLVVNLFPLVATDPEDLARAQSPLGPDNDPAANRSALDAALFEAQVCVVAWGATPFDSRALRELAAQQVDWLRTAAAKRAQRLFCLGTTKDGHPRHPLYLSASTPLVLWLPPASTPAPTSTSTRTP